MYKGKPVIIFQRPWYRHSFFPWGWYSLATDTFDSDEIVCEGAYSVSDGGGGIFRFDSSFYTSVDCGGTVIDPESVSQ